MEDATNPPRHRLLGIYLDDHRAGAAGGVSLARRMLGSNTDNYLTPTLRQLTDEIDSDRRVLDDVIARLGYTPSRIKNATAIAGEWIGRLKSNGYVRRYSPLSRLEEFELLSAGILTKESLWRSCELALTGRREVADIDFSALRQAAERQRAQLETHRARIVEEALGTAAVVEPRGPVGQQT